MVVKPLQGGDPIEDFNLEKQLNLATGTSLVITRRYKGDNKGTICNIILNKMVINGNVFHQEVKRPK